MLLKNKFDNESKYFDNYCHRIAHLRLVRKYAVAFMHAQSNETHALSKNKYAHYCNRYFYCTTAP